jgi:hypothetical protein
MAADKLSQSTVRLQKSLQRTHQYFDQVLNLRKHWKIIGPTQLAVRNKPFFLVDISYKNGISQ